MTISKPARRSPASWCSSESWAGRRRGTALALAVLLVAATAPAAGQGGRGGIGTPRVAVAGVPRGKAMVRASLVARRLAKAVKKVQRRFDRNRQALPTVQGPDGGPGHPRQAVRDLIDGTAQDLDRAIAGVGEPRLAGLRDWASEELRRIGGQVDAPAGAGIAAHSTRPQAVAVVASLGLPPLGDAQPQGALGAGRSSQILGEVARVIGRLFFLAKREDLEVRLWVGSTPAQHATFRFWLESSGSLQSPAIIRTNGTQEHVPRGLYFYSAAPGAGPAIQWPAGPRDSEGQELDLVEGSGFFCCRFEDRYCHHVDTENDCRPDRR